MCVVRMLRSLGVLSKWWSCTERGLAINCGVRGCPGFHSACVTEDHMVYSWGGGEHGQVRGKAILPLYSIVESAPHKTHEGLAPCVAHAGHGAPYVYSRMGCMPVSRPPQLGHSDKINRTAPCAVEALGGKAVVYVACGWSHSVFLGGDGRVSHACMCACVGGMHGCLRIVRTSVCGFEVGGHGWPVS